MESYVLTKSKIKFICKKNNIDLKSALHKSDLLEPIIAFSEKTGLFYIKKAPEQLPANSQKTPVSKYMQTANDPRLNLFMECGRYKNN